jgi:hypothetical protein
MRKLFEFLKTRHYSPPLIAAGFILISLLIILLLLPLFGDDLITIPVFVQELGTSSEPGVFTFQIKGIAKIVLLGPVHSLICYMVIHPLIRHNAVQELKSKPQYFSRSSFLELLLIFFLMMNTTGHVIHWVCDRANTLYRLDVGGYNTDPTFLLIYAADEFVGHALVHSSYFIFFFILADIEFIDLDKKQIKWDEWIIILLVAIGIGVINGYVARLGESALILLILSIFGILLIGVKCVFYKRPPLQSPMICSFLFGCVVVIVYNVFIIMKTGLLPYYPFIT